MAKRTKANTAKKQAYVAELLKANPKHTMNAIGKAVTKKFGTQLAYDKLRQAFVAGGGKLAKRGPRRGSKKARKAGARKPGRRKSDRAAARLKRTITGSPAHLVVVMRRGTIEPNAFDTLAAAREFATECLSKGALPAEVSYYERRPLAITTSI